jgi:hypothetical protein
MRTQTASGTAGQRDWVVLVEAAPGEGEETSLMDVETARVILGAMGDDEGVAIQCPDRVGLQVRLTALDPVTALSTALTRWRAAAGSVGPAGWTVVRAEVLTDREFERDVQAGLS